MIKNEKILVHKMDDWFSGIYLKPMHSKAARPHAYEEHKPHRHDFYYIVLLDKGQMDIDVDFKAVSLSGPALFLSYPGQIHQIRSADLEKGWFLAFDPGIMDQKLLETLDRFLSETIVLKLALQQTDAFSALLSHMYEIYSGAPRIFKDQIVRSLVNALLFQVASVYVEQEQTGLVRYSVRSVEIARGFRLLVRRDFRTVKRPSLYASKMNISVTHLNDTVRKVTGFSVTHFIQQEVMREAQRLLFQTDLSVKEIADALGFEDEKYFNRLFSKIVGASPGVFRKVAGV